MRFADVITEATWGQRDEILFRKRCLGIAFCAFFEYVPIGTWVESLDRLAEIIRRTWPERVRVHGSAMDHVVTFNDHPETTFADVKKAAREWDLETDLHGAA